MKKVISLFLVAAILHTSTFASKLKGVQVHGNVRIETEAIISELPVKPGEEYGDMAASDALKALNYTGYFSDISVKIDNEKAFVEWAQKNDHDNLLKYSQPEIRKTEVKNLINSGETVPGASLIRTQSLIVK